MLAPLTNQFGCGYCLQKGGASRAAGAVRVTLWVRRQRQYDGLARRTKVIRTIDLIRAAVSAFASET